MPSILVHCQRWFRTCREPNSWDTIGVCKIRRDSLFELIPRVSGLTRCGSRGYFTGEDIGGALNSTISPTERFKLKARRPCSMDRILSPMRAMSRNGLPETRS